MLALKALTTVLQGFVSGIAAVVEVESPNNLTIEHPSLLPHFSLKPHSRCLNYYL